MSEARFTPDNPCPICGGDKTKSSGSGRRCWGFLSDDGTHAYCTREAGNLTETYKDTEAYAHRLEGRCKCGEVHGDDHRGPIVRVVAPPSGGRTWRDPDHVYDYRDEKGTLVYQAVRWDARPGEAKRFALRRPDASKRSGWAYNADGVDRLLYRLPELTQASRDRTVLVAEGEKAVEALIAHGFLATTNSEGAGKWSHDLSTALVDRNVVVLPDNDEAGQHHADAVAASLVGVVATLRVVALPGLPQKGDAADWFAAGHTPDELRSVVAAARPWARPSAPANLDASEDEWIDPTPLHAFERPSFPVDALPDWVVARVEEVSRQTQTRADAAAMLALAVLATCVQKRFKVCVSPEREWFQPLCLWVLVALASGNRKSAVYKAMTKVLSDHQRDAAAEMELEIKQAETQHAIIQNRLEQIKREAGKLEAEKGVSSPEAIKARRRAEEATQQLHDHMVPKAPRFTADDVTPEKLVGLMQEHEGRMAIFSPEGGIFQIMSGIYSQGVPKIDVYLKAQDAEDVAVDRVGGRNEYVHEATLSVGVAVQPTVLQDMTSREAMRGRGLLGRFLYAVPESTVGTRDIDRTVVRNSRVGDAYKARVLALLSEIPARRDDKGRLVPEVLSFDDAGLDEMEWFEEWMEPHLGEGSEFEPINEWASKLTGQVGRIAALLHLADHATDPNAHLLPIGGDTAARAGRIGQYLIEHAKAAYATMSANPQLYLAERVLKRLEAMGAVEFTRADLWRSMRNHSELQGPESLDTPLEILEEHGYVRRLVEGPKGAGRPSKRYQSNPRWITKARPRPIAATQSYAEFRASRQATRRASRAVASPNLDSGVTVQAPLTPGTHAVVLPTTTPTTRGSLALATSAPAFDDDELPF